WTRLMSNGWVIRSSFELGRCEEPSCGAAQGFATTSVDPGSRPGSGVACREHPFTFDEGHLAASLGDLLGRMREEVAVDDGQIRALADLDGARLAVEVVHESGPDREGGDRRLQVEPLLREEHLAAV